jgi:hypothetical protein
MAVGFVNKRKGGDLKTQRNILDCITLFAVCGVCKHGWRRVTTHLHDVNNEIEKESFILSAKK